MYATLHRTPLLECIVSCHLHPIGPSKAYLVSYDVIMLALLGTFCVKLVKISAM